MVTKTKKGAGNIKGRAALTSGVQGKKRKKEALCRSLRNCFEFHDTIEQLTLRGVHLNVMSVL